MLFKIEDIIVPEASLLPLLRVLHGANTDVVITPIYESPDTAVKREIRQIGKIPRNVNDPLDLANEVNKWEDGQWERLSQEAQAWVNEKLESEEQRRLAQGARHTKQKAAERSARGKKAAKTRKRKLKALMSAAK
jgi:hypothetical protein